MLSYEKRAHLAHVGVILSNVSIATIVFGAVSLVSALIAVLMPALLIVGWFVAIFFSVGILLLLDGFRTFPQNVGTFMEGMTPFLEGLSAAAPYMIGVGLALAVLSAVLLPFEPSMEKHHGRIVCAWSFVGLAVVVLVGIVMGGVSA